MYVPLACAALLTWLSPAGAQQVIDRVVARVGAEAITLIDLRAALGLGMVDAVDEDAALQQLIDRRLALQEVDRLRPTEPDPAAVEVEVDRMKAYSGPRLGPLLESTGIPEARLQEIARDTIRMQAYLVSRFPAVPVSDADAEEYYRAHPEAFRRNGVLMSFEEAAAAARAGVVAERRNARITQWLGNLRNRVEVAFPPPPRFPAPPREAPPPR